MFDNLGTKCYIAYLVPRGVDVRAVASQREMIDQLVSLKSLQFVAIRRF